MKKNSYLRFILPLYLLSSLPKVHGQNILSDTLAVGSNIRDLLAQQALTCALGAIAFGWIKYDRRAAMLVGPAGAINAVLTDYSSAEGTTTFMKDGHFLEGTTLIIAYFAWLFPCAVLTFKNSWLGFTLSSLMGIFQFFLYLSWKCSTTLFVFKLKEENYGFLRHARIFKDIFGSKNDETDDSDTLEIKQTRYALNFTCDYTIWRSSIVYEEPGGGCSYPSIFLFFLILPVYNLPGKGFKACRVSVVGDSGRYSFSGQRHQKRQHYLCVTCSSMLKNQSW